MAGFSGKSAWIAGAKQTAKGSVAAAPLFANAFSGGNIAPVLATDRLSETDSSRDQAAAYITTSGVEGSPELYVRPESLGFWLTGVLGNTVSTGSTPNYTHTIKPGQTLPWLTLWRNIGGAGALFERFQDCQAGSITIAAEAGQPLSATVGVQGLIPTRLTVDPLGSLTLDSDVPFNFNNAAITLGGASTRLIRSFSLTVENNLERQQTDDVVPYDITAGQREISLSFDLLFEDLTEYNKFYYGGATGTAISPNIFTTAANFTFTLDANNEIAFDLPSIAYEEFPAEPDPAGGPIVSSVRAVAQKATGVTDLLTATLKNQTASY
jgi:hypothetical protein